MPIQPHIQFDGLAEIQRDLKRAEGKLPKALGEAHKQLGQFVIAKVPKGNPHAVGTGMGSVPRPSATKRDVIIRAGYSGRMGKKWPWGKVWVQPFAKGRPYILGTIEKNELEIIEKYREVLLDNLHDYFYSAK